MTPAGDTSAVDIAVTVEAGAWTDVLPDFEARIRASIDATLALFDDMPANAEVSVLLTDDAHQQVLNRDWRGQDKPTNVLSFPGDDPDDVSPHAGQGAPVLLGDITLALETIAREAGEQQKKFADHFCHLLVHGMLHLLGFDHESQDQADEMESLETEILDGLGIADPYQD